MFIFNSIFRLASLSYRLIKSCGRRTRQASPDEERPLLDQDRSPSFTGGFETFSQTSIAQRRCIVHVIIYYAAAVLGFSFLVEKWTIIDSMYYATVLGCTIGFGDLAPSNSLSRVYTICLASYGVILLGIFLGILGKL
jgi:hypothetical protein